LLNNPADLGLKTHVEHAISLVQDEVLDLGQTDRVALHEIDETARRGHEKFTAHLELLQLVGLVGATVDDNRTNGRSVRKLRVICFQS